MHSDPDANTILYTGLNDTNAMAYLVAAKSFLRFYDKVSVVVQNDGTIGELNIQNLKHHVKDIQIYSKTDMMQNIYKKASMDVQKVLPDLNDCHILLPLKLLNVIYRFSGKKVIFLDSDMIVIKRPEYIINWIESSYKQDFYSGGGSLLASTFHKIGFDFPTININNFNSGLLGIKSEVSEGLLSSILKKINEFDASLFKNWEIEQAIWSVILSQRPNPVNIDDLEEIYIGGGARSFKELKNKAIITHFVGALRFNWFKYPRLAWWIEKQLPKC